jgi:RND family efflux transporter MFP subunit
LPDVEVASLKTGASLSIAIDALPGREFRGVVTSISPVADSSTRLFPVELTVPNPKRALLAGMIATVEPRAVQPQPVLVAPLGAVVSAKGGPYGVMLVEESGGHARAVSRPVTLGETYGNRIQITGGLREGDRVVVSGPSLLTDGDPVRVIP